MRKRAEQLGLTAFIDALQQGDLRADQAAARFELAYARWWLPAAVDRREPLRAFQKFLHENAIEEFRRLDDHARRAAAARARALFSTAYHPATRFLENQNWVFFVIR